LHAIIGHVADVHSAETTASLREYTEGEVTTIKTTATKFKKKMETEVKDLKDVDKEAKKHLKEVETNLADY